MTHNNNNSEVINQHPCMEFLQLPEQIGPVKPAAAQQDSSDANSLDHNIEIDISYICTYS